ncbi:MAG: hypothetical protein WBR33_05480 [Pseudonocardiaceae bacterium]
MEAIEAPGPLLIPATVAIEVCLMLVRRRGTYAELAFLSDDGPGPPPEPISTG